MFRVQRNQIALTSSLMISGAQSTGLSDLGQSWSLITSCNRSQNSSAF